MTIPIVCATDDGYAKYAATTIYSLLENADKESFYEIHILHANGRLSKENQAMLCNLSNDYADVKTKDITQWFSNIKLERSNVCDHISQETFYRFYILEGFLQYEKILYIDVDIIVLGNIKELYETDLKDNILGVGKLPDRIKTFIQFSFKNDINVPLENYFNAGILLFNIKECVNKNILKECFSLLENDIKYDHEDQDILNIVANNRVEFFDTSWNMYNTCIVKSPTKEQLPNIIHYAGAQKPWNYLDIRGAEFFIDYAKKLNLLADILLENISKNMLNNYFKYFMFPYEKIKKHSNVVLYGGGMVGYILAKQLQFTNYSNVVMHCDKNYSSDFLICSDITQVNPPEDILKINYDYVIVCVEFSNLADVIKKDLILLGVDESKIVWQDYHNIIG